MIMAGVVFNIIASVVAVSLISLIGVVSLIIKKEVLKKALLLLVSFSAGALFGGAFIHLLPEAVDEYGFSIRVSLFLLLGIMAFFVLEKFLHWRHCHTPTSKEHPHPLAFINLVGDGIHNFIDGLVIAVAYLTGLELGVATTMAVILHEIPQEIGDFGILLYAGIGRKKALLFNFASALVALVGAVIAIVMNGMVENISMFLLPFAAGGFIYIAGADLIPELHKETDIKKSSLQLICLLFGILLMLVLKHAA